MGHSSGLAKALFEFQASENLAQPQSLQPQISGETAPPSEENQGAIMGPR